MKKLVLSISMMVLLPVLGSRVGTASSMGTLEKSGTFVAHAPVGTMVTNGTMIHSSGTSVKKSTDSYKPAWLNKPIQQYQHPWTGNDTLRRPSKVSQSISERVQALTKSQNVFGGVTKPTPNKLSSSIAKLFGATKTAPKTSAETFIPRTKVNKSIPLEPMPENIAKADAQAKATLQKIELKPSLPPVIMSRKVTQEKETQGVL